jgi:Outer membrane protein beta-barrel domain
MNKIIFCTIVFACFFARQVNAQAEFSGGLRGGLVTSQVSGDGLAGWNKFGGALGAFVQMSFRENQSITFELQYLNKGSRKPGDPDNGDFNTFDMKLNYIEVPITFNYRRSDFQFDLGLYAGVLTSSKIMFNGNDYGIDPPFENLDLGLIGGVHWLASERVSFILRASTSLLPVRPSPNPVQQFSYYEQGQYNQVLSLLLGYSF